MNAIIESYLQGVATRNVEKVISHLGVTQISASYVSKVAQELDVKVTEFMERSVDSYIPYLFVDASYFKVRDGVKYVSKALLIVAGIREDGYREILGARVADAEHELTWEGIFSDLKDWGLTKVDLIISDGHTGIQSAASRMFPGSSWQMCHVHFIRAVLRKVPRKHHKVIAETLKECLSASGRLLELRRPTRCTWSHSCFRYNSPVPPRVDELPGVSSGTLEKDPDYQSPGTR